MSGGTRKGGWISVLPTIEMSLCALWLESKQGVITIGSIFWLGLNGGITMEERIMAIVYREIEKMEPQQARREVETLISTLELLAEGM